MPVENSDIKGKNKSDGSAGSFSALFGGEGRNTDKDLVKAPAVNLPRGGGAIKSIDEQFAVNAVNGTADLSLPLPVSSARGFSPDLSLSYSSGNGNGIFGMGWNAAPSSIKRKTVNELPLYYDETDSDTYIYSERVGRL
jgi:Salmonella virulence plasmid 65kDa B protein